MTSGNRCASQLCITLVLVVCLHLPGRLCQDDGGKDLIGWLGETYDTGAPQNNEGRIGMKVLSWEPRIFLYHNFLTDEECDEMVKQARPYVRRSGVANAQTGASEFSQIRTSSGMFFSRSQSPLIKRVEDRLARWTMLPSDNGEGIQVLRYEPTQKYDPHHDYFSFAARDDNGGNRMATVLMYLTNVDEGGETVFPKVKPPATQTLAQGWSECAMKGLAVKPKKGSVVLFWSIKPSGAFDPASLHGSCPVVKGEKWSATKWIHVGHYAMGGERQEKITRVMYLPPRPPQPDDCKNRHELCEHWAEAGECESNPSFMIGTKDNPGSCIRACYRCDLMAGAARSGGSNV